ncbi:MAG: hypothetical protein R2911_27480 [Caldilineaceae bacterium]
MLTGLLWQQATITHGQSQPCVAEPSFHQRLGVNVERTDGRTIDSYNAARLEAGWYHDYSVSVAPSRVNGMQHVQLVRATISTADLDGLLGPAVDNNPGALWLLGNEPDRFSQDGVLAADYAVFYHDVYTFLKARDPSARVAIGGILQPTPLRLLYLDAVLDAYRTAYGEDPPADAWHMHNFILREATDWGAYYPPGFLNPPYTNANGETVAGRAYGVADHGDLAIFKTQMRDFRHWMQRNGYRNLPLVVSEYGILLPEAFGYGHAEVRDFMVGSFDYFATETDPLLGYPADANRLVQQWAWFTMNDDYEFNGSLFDYDTGAITPLGEDFATYANSLKTPGMNLGIGAWQVTAQPDPADSGAHLLTAQVEIHNRGAHRAEDVLVRVWLGDPRAEGMLLASAPPLALVEPGCSQTQTVALSWREAALAPGSYTLYVDVQGQSGAHERDAADNYASTTLLIADDPTATPITTPTPPAATTPTPGATPTPTASTPTPAPATPGPTAVPTVPPLLVTLQADVEAVTAATEQIHYVIRVVNTARNALAAVTVEEQVPLWTEFAAAPSQPGWTCQADGQAADICTYIIARWRQGRRPSSTLP